MRAAPAFLLITSLLLATPAWAGQADRWFTTSDGVRLHYVDTGTPPQRGPSVSARARPTLVFVPGWTMPGWIFANQVRAFQQRWRVVVLDPRGQGLSDVPGGGYTYARRGEDIADLVARLGPARVVLIGWSLGVLDSLAYVHAHGDAALAGMVLIDNSVGEEPAPVPSRQPSHRTPRQSHAAFMAGFVRSMFRRPQPAQYLAELTRAALRTPEFAARALLAYAVPRSYWRDAIYGFRAPVLYIVRPGLAGQAANLAAHRAGAESLVVPDLGHAMFVDDPARFDATLQDFLARRIGG